MIKRPSEDEMVKECLKELDKHNVSFERKMQVRVIAIKQGWNLSEDEFDKLWHQVKTRLEFRCNESLRYRGGL